MKERYTKLLGCDLYIKEVKMHWWSRWEIVKLHGLIPIAYRHYKGKYIEEWDYQREKQRKCKYTNNKDSERYENTI